MKKHNRIKDLLINHIYDHCYNEIVHKIESPKINVSFIDPESLSDPTISTLVDAAIKSGGVKGYYSPRKKEYCRVLIKDDTIHKTLSEKLKAAGFKKSKNLYKKIVRAHNELIAKSYLSRNKPIEDEVKLTDKGLKHYLEGKSFEHDFTSRKNSRIALVISIVSILIALYALFF